MWEVMSYGERPYWNWSNQDVIKAIEKGYRWILFENLTNFVQAPGPDGLSRGDTPTDAGLLAEGASSQAGLHLHSQDSGQTHLLSRDAQENCFQSGTEY